MSTAHFSPAFFAFLSELRTHNDKAWFDAHKPTYLRDVRDPLVRFITDLVGPLRDVAPRYVADPRPVGGSMLRIHRDTRFSKDKSPYKTNMAAHFWHADGKEGATPAFYLYLEPGKSGIGCGIWQPEAKALQAIRQAIADRPQEWQRVVGGASQRSACGFMGESLKKPPAGFDPAHPCIEDLKRKDFAVSRPLTDAEVTHAAFLDTALTAFRDMAPFLDFLSGAVGLPP